MDRVTQANATQTEQVSGTAGSLLSHAEQLLQVVGRFELGKEPSGARHSSAGNQHDNQRAPAASHGRRPQVMPDLGMSTSSGNDSLLEF